MIPPAAKRWHLAGFPAGAAVAVLILAVAGRFWPGVPMYDTVAQYQQVIGQAPVDDWHPPLMVRLWQLLHWFGGGTEPMFALQVGLYATGFALLVAALVRIGRWRSGLAGAVLALSPLLLGWEMVVLKDLQMLSALLAAIGLIAWFRLSGRPVPRLAGAAVAILILYATLLRANGVFITAPLCVLLLPMRNRLLSGGLAAVSAVAVLALSPIINHTLLKSEPSGIERVEPVFDLAGIMIRTPRLAPSIFTRAERAQIVSRHCVKAYFWDPLGDPSVCGPATDRVRDQPAKELYLELARSVMRQPGAYAFHRLAHWNSTERWLVPPGLPDGGPPDDAEDNDLHLAASTSPLVTSWQGWAADEMGTPLGWPIMWTVLALLLLPIAWNRRADAAGNLAFALLASAITLEASFLVISIASDLRYHLWPMTAAALALILLSDGVALKKWEWIAALAALASVAAGGVAARSILPAAPDSYEDMIAAASD